MDLDLLFENIFSLNAVTSFLFEVYKIFLDMAPYILLGLFFVGIMNLWITKDIVQRHIGKNNLSSIIKASIFGIPLPLCSCGVIPTAVYMSQNKASKPAVVSFLTSTPQTGIDSILATYGMMGPIFAIYRPIAALFIGFFGGVLTMQFHKEKPKAFFSLNVINDKVEESKKTFSDKFIKYPYIEFLDDISPQFIVGIIIAGLISFLIPDDFFAGSGLNEGILSMLLMIVIGVPMYICATASIPIAVALMLKGFSPGAAFVFLAVGPATNAASFTVLSKSLGKKIVTIYLIGIILSSLAFGYLLDFIFNYFNYNYIEQISSMHHHNHEDIGILTIASGIILFILLSGSIYRIYLKKYFVKKSLPKGFTEIKIDGMTCSHCSDTVTKTLSGIENISEVQVNHQTGRALFKGNPDKSVLKSKIADAGYELVD